MEANEATLITATLMKSAMTSAEAETEGKYDREQSRDHQLLGSQFGEQKP